MTQLRQILHHVLLLAYGLQTNVNAVDMPTCGLKKISKVGCFSEYSPHSKQMKVLFSERPHIKWDKDGFASFVDGLLCKCAVEAKKKGYAFFSIRFFGLCVVNKKYQDLIDLINNWPWHKNDCIKGDGGYEPCDNTNNGKCLGVNDRDFIYTYEDDPWSQWSACSASCGHGTQYRNRLFPYPPQESQSCIDKECPSLTTTKKPTPPPTTKRPTTTPTTTTTTTTKKKPAVVPYHAPAPTRKIVPTEKQIIKAPQRAPPMPTRKMVLPTEKEIIHTPPQPPSAPRSRCVFKPGDGKSAMEWYLGEITRRDTCIDLCIEKRKEMPHINGVKMYSALQSGCWCEMGVQTYTSMDDKDTFQTCILEIGQPCGPFNGGCNQNCEIVNSQYNCSCHDGYALIDDGKTCHDINECIMENGGCDHECVNKEGGYTCACNKGYTLKPNKKSCEVANKQEYHQQ